MCGVPMSVVVVRFEVRLVMVMVSFFFSSFCFCPRDIRVTRRALRARVVIVSAAAALARSRGNITLYDFDTFKSKNGSIPSYHTPLTTLNENFRYCFVSFCRKNGRSSGTRGGDASPARYARGPSGPVANV